MVLIQKPIAEVETDPSWFLACGLLAGILFYAVKILWKLSRKSTRPVTANRGPFDQRTRAGASPRAASTTRDARADGVDDGRCRSGHDRGKSRRKHTEPPDDERHAYRASCRYCHRPVYIK
ncbi:hypothetical protein EVAR_49976_1 [Eumeta japonica]|uniref:Uncharacterized protein n=1 Tax=Eumeta variegata TaxID=151549 RepID=A0A4C1YNF3_EUMVA|nr:hypothetical protein EVAR_49976_1 [Eumeta japonica]